MAITPEQEKQTPSPESVLKEIPQEPEVPKEIVQEGVAVRPTQFTAQVVDDTGAPLVQSPATNTITITLPASPQQLSDWSKGSPSLSLTWFASFWLRIIKKALLFGWNVVMGNTS